MFCDDNLSDVIQISSRKSILFWLFLKVTITVTVSEETLWKKKCTIKMYDDDPFELLSDHRTCSQLVGRILLLN